MRIYTRSLQWLIDKLQIVVIFKYLSITLNSYFIIKIAYNNQNDQNRFTIEVNTFIHIDLINLDLEFIRII